MDNYIEGDYLVYDCGCRFKILEGMPNLRVEVPTDITKIRKDCERTWRIFAEGNTKGIFQLETRFGQQYSKKLIPENIEHLSGLMSILRPSCLNAISNGKSVTDSYIDRKNNVEESISAHPALENILDKTYHQNIYQEQSLQISREIAGFSLQQADILRKSIGKKRADLMAKSKEEFIEGAKKTGIVDEETAEIIFGWIESASRYGFNKSLSPETIVETYWGHKKTVDEVCIGEYVSSPNGYVEVINKYENGIQDVYEVELEDGKTIECTMNHKFLCEDNIIRPLYEILFKGHEIICN